MQHYQRSIELDVKGRHYTLAILEDNTQLLIKLYDRQTLIGEAKCVQESPETMYLGDIAIANGVLPTAAKRLSTLLRKIPGYQAHQPQPVNYRDRGIGSALLEFLIEQARTRGIQNFYGRVFRQDVENTPKLLDWYQKHGFEIRQPMSDDPHSEDVVALIYRTLQ